MHGHADFEDTYLASPRRTPMPPTVRKRRRTNPPGLTWAVIIAIGLTLALGYARLRLG